MYKSLQPDRTPTVNDSTQPAAPLPSPFAPPQGALAAPFAAHQAGRFEEAAAGYRAVLAGDARNVQALHLLGGALLQSGDFAGAEAKFREALAVREEPVFLLSNWAFDKPSLDLWEYGEGRKAERHLFAVPGADAEETDAAKRTQGDAGGAHD